MILIKSKISKINFTFLFILIITAVNCYANTISNSNKATIQTILDHFHHSTEASATVLSINFPENKNETFVNGTTANKSSQNPTPPCVNSNNLFQIGSITKSFTAAIILQLEAENKLAIKDSLSTIQRKYGEFLPQAETKKWKKITIQQLLNMTSGIFDYTDDKDFKNRVAYHPETSWDSAELLDYGYQHPSYFSPGKGWHYSNTNYIILGLLIEKVTGNSFENEINERILRKYFFKNTYYLPYVYPPNIIQTIAQGYAYKGGGYSPPLSAGTNMTTFNLSAAGPAGALVSNSEDIARWVSLLFRGKILPEKQLNEMLSAVCTDRNKSCKPGELLKASNHSEGFSLGLARMFDPKLGIIWVYTGGTPGYSSSLLWLPNRKISFGLTDNISSEKNKNIITTLIQVAKVFSLSPSTSNELFK